jgi:hypothetical protein
VEFQFARLVSGSLITCAIEAHCTPGGPERANHVFSTTPASPAKSRASQRGTRRGSLPPQAAARAGSHSRAGAGSSPTLEQLGNKPREARPTVCATCGWAGVDKTLRAGILFGCRKSPKMPQNPTRLVHAVLASLLCKEHYERCRVTQAVWTVVEPGTYKQVVCTSTRLLPHLIRLLAPICLANKELNPGIKATLNKRCAMAISKLFLGTNEPARPRAFFCLWSISGLRRC